MTENEVKFEELKDAVCELVSISEENSRSVDFERLDNLGVQIIDSIEELQQYRAIETELREQYHANVDIKMLIKHFIETIFKGEKHEGFCILTNEDAKMWDEYRAIGTVEECEKAMDFELAKQDKMLTEVIDDYLKYIKIGTIDEFKALKEKEELDNFDMEK